MIDTIKIYAPICKNIYDIINNNSIVKTSYSKNTGEVFYNIVTDKLEGSYSSNISVRVLSGRVFSGLDSEYYITIEGSYHKFKNGYNSHNGFYDFKYLCNFLIGNIEQQYKIELPQLSTWYVMRVDIACVYDLENQDNIATYINNLKLCSFPRRKPRFYKNESLYYSGTSTTLKIYNKMLEFKKNDMKKFRNTDFNINEYLEQIKGFIRFECEIKKKKLEKFYKRSLVNVLSINYDDLKSIWSNEFMKLLKCNNNSELVIIKSRTQLEEILNKNFKPVTARNLYNFYTSYMIDGEEAVRSRMSSSSYYRYLGEFNKLHIDLSQSYNVEITNKIINFNPFFYSEVI